MQDIVAPVQARILRDAEQLDDKMARLLRVLAESFLTEQFTVKTWFETAGVLGQSAKARFRRLLKTTPKTYLDTCRFEVALRMMKADEALTIREISEQVGYSLESSFYEAFRRRFDMTPSEARRLITKHDTTIEEVLKGQGLKSLSTQETSENAAGNEGRKNRGTEETDRKFFNQVVWPFLRKAPLRDRFDVALNGFSFRTGEVVRLLMRKSLEDFRADRSTGLVIADAAIVALASLEPSICEHDALVLRIESLANFGNIQRLAGDPIAAERTFAEAEKLLSESSVPMQLKASVLARKAHLQTCRRLFSQADVLLDKARRIATNLAQPNLLAQVAIAQGYSLELQGELEKATGFYDEAVLVLETAQAPSCYLKATVYSRLSSTYLLARDFSLAAANLRRAQSEWSSSGQTDSSPSLQWLEGLLAHGMGHIGDAEKILSHARLNLIESGEAVSSALVAIDLALLYLQKRDYGKARNVAAEALPILEEARLDDEALSAFSILKRAFRSETVTISALMRLREALEITCNAPRWGPIENSISSTSKGTSYPKGSRPGPYSVSPDGSSEPCC